MAVTISDARIRVTLDTGDAVREAEELDRELVDRQKEREDRRDRSTEREGARSDPFAPENRDRDSGGGGGGSSRPGFSFTTFGERDGGGLTPGRRVPLIPARARIDGVPPGGGDDGGFSALARLVSNASDVIPIVGATAGAAIATGIAADRFGPIAAGAADELGVPGLGGALDEAGSQVAALRAQFRAFGQTREQLTQEAIAQSRLTGRVNVESLADVAAARFRVNAELGRVQREERAAVKREVGGALATTGARLVSQFFDLTKAATR